MSEDDDYLHHPLHFIVAHLQRVFRSQHNESGMKDVEVSPSPVPISDCRCQQTKMSLKKEPVSRL